ncbi:MAG: hypothetical protein Q8P67_28745, partial [archaeon]|nr:hypothetical protein [archaeon]
DIFGGASSDLAEGSRGRTPTLTKPTANPASDSASKTLSPHSEHPQPSGRKGANRISPGREKKEKSAERKPDKVKAPPSSSSKPKAVEKQSLLPVHPATARDVEVLHDRIAQLVSICNDLYLELVGCKRANSALAQRITILETPSSHTSSSSSSSTSSPNSGSTTSTRPLPSSAGSRIASMEKFENVSLRRQLATLRRETREDVVDEDSLQSKWSKQTGLSSQMELMSATLMEEVDEADSPSTLFRGRSATTILISKFLQAYGKGYQQEVLLPPIQKLIDQSAEMCCEVNPRLIDSSPSKDLAANRENLKHAFFLLLSAILGNSVPSEFSELFKLVVHHVSTRFPGTTMDLRAIGGFFFLRFVCPYLVSFPASPEGRRTLLYVSKILQNLANNQPFDKKEAYMIEFNSILIDTHTEMTQFLTQISRGRASSRASTTTLEKRKLLTRDDSDIGLKSQNTDLGTPLLGTEFALRSRHLNRKNLCLSSLGERPFAETLQQHPAPSSPPPDCAAVSPPHPTTSPEPSLRPVSIAAPAFNPASFDADSVSRVHSSGGRGWTRAIGSTTGKKYAISISVNSEPLP